MEDIRKLEELLKGSCVELSCAVWPSPEPTQESPFYSRHEQAYYDLMPEKTRIARKTATIRYRYHRARRPTKVGSLPRYGWKSFLSPELKETIRKSRRILDLQDNWDGEGSPGYAPATLNRAV